jgi:glutathione S-transferase
MLPVLYSFRRCPYAMRARLALQYSGIKVELREVVLRDKPQEMLSLSSTGTVPVLELPGKEVLTESWDIMLWALRQNDPECWLGRNESLLSDAAMLVEMNDYSFKPDLDHYKYADRYPQHPREYYRSQGEEFLQQLEEMLASSRFLLGASVTAADIAVFPFIRQFAFVDKNWFDQTPYVNLQQWLQGFLQDSLFGSIMMKYSAWRPGDTPIRFPA